MLFEDLVTQTDRVSAEILEFFGLPVRPLATVSLSQNRTLRNPAFHKARRALNRGPRGLKRFFKRGRVFNFMYLKWMVQQDAKLSPEDRAGLAELLADDVAALKELLGQDIPQWHDFAGTGGRHRFPASSTPATARLSRPTTAEAAPKTIAKPMAFDMTKTSPDSDDGPDDSCDRCPTAVLTGSRRVGLALGLDSANGSTMRWQQSLG